MKISLYYKVELIKSQFGYFSFSPWGPCSINVSKFVFLDRVEVSGQTLEISGLVQKTEIRALTTDSQQQVVSKVSNAGSIAVWKKNFCLKI